MKLFKVVVLISYILYKVVQKRVTTVIQFHLNSNLRMVEEGSWGGRGGGGVESVTGRRWARTSVSVLQACGPELCLWT